MPECPKCKEPIDFLYNYSQIEERFIFKNGDYEASGESYPLDGPNEFECPRCGEVLFTSEEEAGRFLRREAAHEATDTY